MFSEALNLQFEPRSAPVSVKTEGASPLFSIVNGTQLVVQQKVVEPSLIRSPSNRPSPPSASAEVISQVVGSIEITEQADGAGALPPVISPLDAFGGLVPSAGPVSILKFHAQAQLSCPPFLTRVPGP